MSAKNRFTFFKQTLSQVKSHKLNKTIFQPTLPLFIEWQMPRHTLKIVFLYCISATVQFFKLLYGSVHEI